jgi:hypothetical protein
MKVGDLVKLSDVMTGPAAVDDWGYGFISEVYEAEFNVEVIWPAKGGASRTIGRSYVEVVSENR